MKYEQSRLSANSLKLRCTGEQLSTYPSGRSKRSACYVLSLRQRRVVHRVESKRKLGKAFSGVQSRKESCGKHIVDEDTERFG